MNTCRMDAVTRTVERGRGMSILIKGMEMPKSCAFCRFNGAYCYAKGDEDAHSIMPCPLVPVPSHGDLISRDELEVVVETHYKHHKISRYDRDLLLHYLDVEMAPTIIPAEEGE